MSYMNQNKKHKQTLESAQYELEISFKYYQNILHTPPPPLFFLFSLDGRPFFGDPTPLPTS